VSISEIAAEIDSSETTTRRPIPHAASRASGVRLKDTPAPSKRLDFPTLWFHSPSQDRAPMRAAADPLRSGSFDGPIAVAHLPAGE
jgi:hypothetical protein